MWFLLKWGAERKFGGHEVTLNNAYLKKNFFVYNLPIILLGVLLGDFSIWAGLNSFFLMFFDKKKLKLDKKKLKQHLVGYIGVVSVLFVSHLILFAFTLVWWPNLENNYRASIKETVKIIGEQRNHTLKTECDFMRELSQQFSCCGYDAEDAYVVGWKEHGKLCCTVNANSSGCLQPSLDRIKAYHIWFFVIPSGFSLLCELVLAYFWIKVYRKRYPPQVPEASVIL
jgi:hypothetical protein